MLHPQIETRRNRNHNQKFVCEHVFPELTAVCPVTRLPDHYVMTLRYEPDALLPELKSLKLYLISYRNVEILHEELTNRILNDVIRVVRPRWIVIEIRVNVRGGIYTKVTRRWIRRKGDIVIGGPGVQ